MNMPVHDHGRGLDTALPVVGGGVAATAAGPPPTAAGNGSYADQNPMFAVACPGITQPQTRQVSGVSSPSTLQGVLNIDWWESAGCVEWGPDSSPFFDEIERHQNQAIECRAPVPWAFGDGQIFVAERGIGTGRASRLEFRLEWCGATIGLSARKEPTRLLSNFYLNVPGKACLIRGVDNVRETVYTWLEQWGGTLVDEWVRRLDLCLDVPGFDLNDRVFPACQAGQYLSTMRRNSSNRECTRTTGFAIGRSPGARLTIYDKLAEVRQKNDSAYGLAMIERRWNGVFPKSAARVEYQMHREFFQQFDGLKNATDLMNRLPDIVERLIQTDQRPFFQLTDAVPDREGRHQSRVGVLPEWAAIIALIRAQVDRPRQPLKRLERNLISAKRACANAIGYLTSAAADLGIVVERKADLVSLLEELMKRNDVCDDVIRLKWEDKARRCGTFEEVCQFPFGANQAA